ncbi:MAG: hypothetical protein IPK95_12370 [Cellvibrionales bacterium]|nr:hypothetical protein [Cellvibrionales bacterium]
MIIKRLLTEKIFFALLAALFSCYSYSLTEDKLYDKKCSHIDFSKNTYKTIPISTDKRNNAGFIFSSTDKIYSHTNKTCITLNNISGEEQEITIRLDNPRIRHVEIIKSQNNSSEAPVVSGLDYPLENWKTIGSEIMFTLSMEPGSTQQVELRLGSIFPYNSQIQISSSRSSNRYPYLAANGNRASIRPDFFQWFFTLHLLESTPKITLIYFFLAPLFL